MFSGYFFIIYAIILFWHVLVTIVFNRCFMIYHGCVDFLWSCLVVAFVLLHGSDPVYSSMPDGFGTIPADFMGSSTQRFSTNRIFEAIFFDARTASGSAIIALPAGYRSPAK